MLFAFFLLLVYLFQNKLNKKRKNMEDFIIDEHISLDYDSDRKNKGLDEYRLSIFDKNLHYTDEIFLSKTHLFELLNGLKQMNLEIDDDL